MSLSNYASKALLDYMFSKTSNFDTQPTIYVGLSTADPLEDGAGITEPSGNGYARVATVAGDWNTATLADPSLLDNANTVTFPQATGAWGTVTHFFLIDASSGGNILGSGALPVPKSPSNLDTPSFAAGALDVTMD